MGVKVQSYGRRKSGEADPFILWFRSEPKFPLLMSISLCLETDLEGCRSQRFVISLVIEFVIEFVDGGCTSPGFLISKPVESLPRYAPQHT